ncbi:MAG: BPSS1780 family membrane protein [Betaproteobacteria bacterium]
MTTPSAAVKVRLRSLPPAAGLAWIRRGVRLFLRRPIGFLGLFAFELLFLLFCRILPAPLALAATVLLPLVALGFMVATEDVLDDVPLRPSVFWVPLTLGQTARRALLTIGMIYVVSNVLILLLGDWLDNGEVRTFMQTLMTPRTDGKMPKMPPLSGAGFAVLMLQSFGAALVAIPLWHAPALVHWGRQGAAQAIFSSVVAVWRTRGALAVFALGWFMVMFGIAFVLGLVAAIVGAVLAAFVLAPPLMMMLTTVFYISIWFCFVDTFEITSSVAFRTVMADTDRPAA